MEFVARDINNDGAQFSPLYDSIRDDDATAERMFPYRKQSGLNIHLNDRSVDAGENLPDQRCPARDRESSLTVNFVQSLCSNSDHLQTGHRNSFAFRCVARNRVAK